VSYVAVQCWLSVCNKVNCDETVPPKMRNMDHTYILGQKWGDFNMGWNVQCHSRC